MTSDDYLERLHKMAARNSGKVVAVGEFGLGSSVNLPNVTCSWTRGDKTEVCDRSALSSYGYVSHLQISILSSS